MKIEVGKFYTGRDGRKIRIYAIDGSGTYNIHGASLIGAGWFYSTWESVGFTMKASDIRESDIVSEWREEETRTIYLNIYPHHESSRPDKETADRDAGTNRLACVPVTFTFKKGDGISQ